MEIPTTYFMLLALTAALLGVQFTKALQNRETVLTILSITFAMYFVYGGMAVRLLIEDYTWFFAVAPESFVWAALYGLLVLAAVALGYRWPQWRTRASPSTLQFVPEALFFTSLVGCGATVLFFVISGGIQAVWSRAWEHQTFAHGQLIGVLGDLTLVYPLYVFAAGRQASRNQRLRAFLIFITYVVAAAVSQRASGHVINAAAFAIVWLQRRRIGPVQLLAVVATGIMTVSVLRFLRYYGTLPVSERDVWDAGFDFFWNGNRLNFSRSFGELFIFAKTIETVEWTGLKWGTSYYVALLSFVPSFLMPSKLSWVLTDSADCFLPVALGYPEQWWPSGFYGEAYFNFGLFGMVIVSMVMGWLLRRSELWLRSSATILGIPAWMHGCYLAASIAGSVRENVNAIVFSYVLRILCLVAIMIPFSVWGSSGEAPAGRRLTARRPLTVSMAQRASR